ncbi:unnamed protein product [Scytosiphon promiscuus]
MADRGDRAMAQAKKVAADPIKQAELMLAEGVGMNEADMREVSHFLLELKNGSESRGDGICGIPHAAPANEIGAGSDLGPHPSSTPLSMDPLQSASPETKGGRQLLLDAALEAIKVAEDPATEDNRVLMARSFHTATVYLEVLSSFNAVSPEHERQLEYTKWRTYQCSHLLENIKHEFLDAEGRVDDHYFLEKDKELGRGTYGRVIQATHRGTGRQFACKVVHVTRMEPRQVSKLYSEVSVLRELDHPHIVRMRQVFYSKRHIFMIMDLATGGELFNLVTKNPGDCATETEIRRMLTNMLSAVGYMHRHGVVHRDLKLENWLMQTPGDTSGVKLIDFGLSKHFAQDQNMQQAVGSTYYVAPEVLQGSYGPKCDMWSMGVIAYMMVSGAPPFWGNGDAQVRAKIVCGEYDMPDVLFRHVSSEAKDFISKLLVVDQEKRMSAEQALAHPWLRRPTRAPSSTTGTLLPKGDLVRALQQFSTFSNFRRLILEVCAYNMPPMELEGLRETFESIDKNHSGTISLEELTSHLQTHVSGSEAQQLFEAVSIDQAAEINYNEFIAATMWTRVNMDEEKLHKAFEGLDREGRGFLTAEGIKQVVGVDFEADEVDRMIAEADVSGDGRVDYSEFAHLWKSFLLQKHQKPSAGRLQQVVRRFGGLGSKLEAATGGLGSKLTR